jgi:MoaA/NifB/PqqE/SkfB family radical SAM enzyme
MIAGWKWLGAEDLRRITEGVECGVVRGGPWHLEIHPTNRCNARCFFCFTEPHRHDQTLPWETLRRVLTEEAARDLRSLRLSGGGEAFTYPQIDPLLDLCQEKGLRFADVTTNGILLPRFAKRLVEIGSDFVFVSLNEPTPELYEKSIRIPQKNFHQAVEGVRALCRERDAAAPENRPVVALQFFVWRENYALLRRMHEFGLELGVDQIVIKSLNGVAPEFRVPAERMDFMRESLLEIIEADSRPDRLRLRFDLSFEGDLNAFALAEQNRRLPAGASSVNPAFVPLSPRGEYCMMPWYSAVVAATGTVYPCCVLTEKPGKEMGDVGETSLHEIWTGPRYRLLRAEFRRLQALRGDMEHSRKHDKVIDPMCLPPFGCYFSFNMCPEAYYRELGDKLETAITPLERAQARLRNAALKTAHRLKGRLRRS